MSNYIESYKARVSHLGNNPQTRAFNSGQLEFKRYLKYNEHTIRNLQTDTIKFDGVILTNKEDENKVTQILLTELSIPICVGNIIYWNNDPWIIYRNTVSSYQPYNKFYIVKCNYEVKWVNADGSLDSSWAHIVGGLDSKIKDNFRT